MEYGKFYNFLEFDENYPHFSWMEYGWGILILWDLMKTWDFLDIFGTFLGLESSGDPGVNGAQVTHVGIWLCPTG